MTIYLHSFHHSFASNGIKITYELIYKLNELGYTAKNLCFDPFIENSNFPEMYLRNTIFCTNESFPQIKDDDIVIYPEHVKDNPLGAKKIVRYLLNKPYFLFGYGINYQESDYVIAFSKLVSKELPILYLLIDERIFFKNIREKHVRDENTISLYFGKCDIDLLNTKKQLIKQLKKNYKKINVITRQYPNRNKALELIRESKFLVSFDPLSNLNYESTLLGVPVLQLDDFYNTKDIDLPAPQKGIFYRLEDFAKAEKEVNDSYNLYYSYIENQNEVIRKAFENIEDHFKRLQTDEHYLEKNKKRNISLKQLDYENFKKREEKIYTSINFYDDIPKEFIHILGMKKNSSALKQHCKLLLTKMHLIKPAKKIFKLVKYMGRH